MTSSTHERLRVIIFNVLRPVWPDGLRVFVPSEDRIAATLAEELLQAVLGGPNAIEQLTLNNKPDSLRLLQRELADHTDNGALEVAIQGMLHDGALLYASDGSELIGRSQQRLIGYMVVLNRDI